MLPVGSHLTPAGQPAVAPGAGGPGRARAGQLVRLLGWQEDGGSTWAIHPPCQPDLCHDSESQSL